MSDVPPELLPDEPKRIGDRGEHDLVIDGVAFPMKMGRVNGETCMACGETKDALHVGFDVETNEPRYICLLCRVAKASPDDSG